MLAIPGYSTDCCTATWAIPRPFAAIRCCASGTDPGTLWLMLAAIAVTIAVGIPAGVIAAAPEPLAGPPDFQRIVALLAMPNFWLGLVMIALFSVRLRWLPSFGSQGGLSLILPSAALAARLIAMVGRMTRGLIIEETRKDYVRTAVAKGLSRHAILLHHVLRNADSGHDGHRAGGRLSAGRLGRGGAPVRLARHRRFAADRRTGRDYPLVQGARCSSWSASC